MLWAKTETGLRFDQISVPEWFEYDEKLQGSVSVTELEFLIRPSK